MRTGNTIAHCIAYCGDLRWHTESWHIDRINSLRKKGCDNRAAFDIQGRAPLLLAFEAYNVLFVKAMLRAEMGEIWTSKNLKRVLPLWRMSHVFVRHTRVFCGFHLCYRKGINKGTRLRSKRKINERVAESTERKYCTRARALYKIDESRVAR